MRPKFLRRTITILVAGAAVAFAQIPSSGPKIGTIDFYGLHKVPELRIRKAAGVVEGGFLPRSKGDVEDRIADVPSVVQAHVEATCCDEKGGAILYIGIEEKGAPHFDTRAAPEGNIKLPDDVIDTYRNFLLAVSLAMRAGITAEDLTRGHSLMADPDTRAVQEKFVDLADKNLATLRKVVRESSDDEQRAIAAYVIGYAPRKAAIVDDLQYALKDSDDTVRGNAVRAMAAVAVYAKLNPDAGVRIEPTWFIEMLNSLSWTDRNNAAVALVNLTESRDPSTLEQIRTRSIAALTDMAKWKHLAHALPAYILLGRVKGFPEKEIQDAWSAGDRKTIIEAPLPSNKK